MTDYRQKNRDGIAAQPKYDVCVTFRGSDLSVAEDLFHIFNQHGITYSTPADEERAEKEALFMLHPKMVRDSYFFLLIDEPGSIDDATVQKMLYKALIYNRKQIVLKRNSGTTYPGIEWDEDTKNLVFEKIAQHILNEPRDPEWIYGERQK